ncbi:MAG: fibronectin type III domain-containing protein [bacterium]|nr:fibronectin type III domain-containing protein [bacterium]
MDEGTSYTFLVRAVSTSNIGEKVSVSESCLTLLSAPTGFECSAVTASSITVGWDALTKATMYRVSDDGSEADKPGYTDWVYRNTAQTSYEFTGLDANTTYHLRAQAQNASGWSTSAELSCTTKLAPPGNPTCSNETASSIKLSWSSVSGAADYEVSDDASTVSDADADWVDATGTSHVFTGLDAGTTYNLRARATSSSNTGESTSVSCLTRPPPPSSLTCSNETASSATMGWNTVSGAIGYEVSDDASTVSDADADWVDATGTSHVFTGLDAGTTYNLRARATSSSNTGESTSVSCLTRPPPPSSLTCSNETASSATMGWNTVSGAIGYEVSDDASTVSDADATWDSADNASERHHTFTGLDANTSYNLRVRAQNASGWGASAALSCTTKLAPPANLVCSDETAMSVTLGWDAVDGATRYQVSSDGGTTWVAASGTSHEFTGLTVSKSYELQVQSGDADSWDSTSTKTCTTSPLPGPANLVCSDETAMSVTLGWDAVDGATRYQVSSDGGTTWVAASGTSHEFSGLTVSKSYELQVQAGDADSWDGTSSKSCSTLPLPAPAKLVCSNETTTSITLGWDAVDGATRYQVSSDGGTTWVAASGTSHVFNGLSSNMSFELRVQAGDADSWDGTSSESCMTSPLPPPAKLVCSNETPTSITLGWDAVDGATRYQVSSDGGTTWVAATGASHVFNGLIPNVDHVLVVQAGDADSWDGKASTTCSTEAGQCMAVSSGSITISWETKDGVFQWFAARATGGGQFTDTQTLDGSVLTATFTGLQAETTYTFYLWWKASSDDDWTRISPDITCRTRALSGPSNLMCTAMTTSITLTWNAVTGATRYQVSKDDGKSWTDAAGTSHEFTDLTSNMAIDVVVQAGDADSWDGKSSAQCSTTGLPGPSKLVCSNQTATSITLSWDAVTGATRYQISRDGAPWSPASGTSHEFTGLTVSTSYELAVQTGDADSWDGKSSVTCSTSPLPATSKLVCSNMTVSSIELGWELVDGATRYQVSRDGEATWAGATGSSHVFTGLIPNVNYDLVVQAGDADSWDGKASVECLTLVGPCTAVSSGSITISWDADSGVYQWFAARLTGGETYTGGQTLAANVLSTTFTGLDAGTTYKFRLWSKTSSTADWVQISPDITCRTRVLPAPSNLVCTATETSITLGWDAVAGATSYRVSRDGAPWSPASGTSHEFAGLTVSTSHELRVQAGDASNRWGTAAEATCSTSPLPGPSNLVCSNQTASSVTLSWDPVAGASTYRVRVNGQPWWPESLSSHVFPYLTVSTSYFLEVQTGDDDGSWDGKSSKTCETSPLPAPANLVCSNQTATSITLGWDSVTGATRYQVSKDGGTTWVAATGTSHEFTGLMSETSFDLRVQAGDADSWDGQASISCSTEAGQCSATTGSITIKWETISGVHQWFAARATTGSAYTDGRTLAADVLTTTFTGLSTETSYTFYLWWKASSDADWTRISPDIECTTSAPATLPPPANLTCTAKATSITLGWDAVTGATRYQVSKDSGTTWVAATGTSHEFTGLASDSSFALKVQAGDADSWDGQASKACSTSKLPAPANLACTVTSTSITLTWDAVTGATTYRVRKDGEPWWSESQTSHEFSSLTSNTQYELEVQAGDGKWGNIATKNCTTATT